LKRLEEHCEWRSRALLTAKLEDRTGHWGCPSRAATNRRPCGSALRDSLPCAVFQFPAFDFTMRRQQLARLGFNTGSPFIPERQMNAKEWHIRFGAKHGVSSPASPSSTAGSSPQPRSSLQRSPSAAVPTRRSGEGVGGRLDPGRLALARATYERINSAPQRTSASAASAAAAASSTPVAAAASSAPISRAASTLKRRRNASNEEDTDENSSTASSNAGTPAKRQRGGAAAEPAAASDVDLPPPLETAGGSPVASAPSTPVPSAHSSGSAAGTPLATPLSSLPQPPRTVDVREKSRSMLRDCLQAAMKHADAAPAASATDAATSSAAAPAVASSFADPSDVSAAIELQLLEANGGSPDVGYRQKLRDLVFNMHSNGPLCLRLLRGDLSPSDVVRLDFKELAAADVAAERERIKEDNFNETLFRPAERIDTEDYRCPTCGSQHCSTLVIREERDISKADTWGSKQGAGSVTEIRCEDCKYVWTKEE